MNKILLSVLLFLFLSFTLSAEEQVETAETQINIDLEPSGLVNKSVNIISGTYVDTSIDFVLPGAEPIYMQRNYISSQIENECQLGHGWLHNHFGCTIGSGQKFDRPRHLYTISDGFGGVCLFGGQKNKKILLFEESYVNCVTNCSHGEISARTNVCNSKFQSNSGGNRLFTRPSGEKLLFSFSGGRKGHKKQYDLKSEKKTNGNSFQYNYSGKGILASVETYNKNKDFLDGFTLQRSNDKSHNPIEVKHRGKLKASYNFKNLSCRKKGGYYYKNKLFLKSVELENGNSIFYDYKTNFETAVLRRKSYPDGRYQKIKYYNRGENSVGDQIVKSYNPPLFL